MIINNVPVICAECERAEIRRKDGKNYLYCTKSERFIYNAKPDWCELPPLFEEDT